VFDRRSLSRAIEFQENRDTCLYRKGGSRLRFDRGMARGIGICCLLISRVTSPVSVRIRDAAENHSQFLNSQALLEIAQRLTLV
jgi:hypothetical protein